jgi:hypothetical protein
MCTYKQGYICDGNFSYPQKLDSAIKCPLHVHGIQSITIPGYYCFGY